MKEQKSIRVVLLEPQKRAKVIAIEPSLNTIKTIIGGDVDVAFFVHDNACLILNVAHTLRTLPLNRRIYNEHKEVVDVISGNAIICSCEGDKFSSLSKNTAQKYVKKFLSPDSFVMANSAT